MRNRIVREPIDAARLSDFIRRVYKRQMMRPGQKFVLDFAGVTLIAKVVTLETVRGLEESRDGGPTFGTIVEETLIEVQKHPQASFTIVNQSSGFVADAAFSLSLYLYLSLSFDRE